MQRSWDSFLFSAGCLFRFRIVSGFLPVFLAVASLHAQDLSVRYLPEGNGLPIALVADGDTTPSREEGTDFGTVDIDDTVPLMHTFRVSLSKTAKAGLSIHSITAGTASTPAALTPFRSNSDLFPMSLNPGEFAEFPLIFPQSVSQGLYIRTVHLRDKTGVSLYRFQIQVRVVNAALVEVLGRGVKSSYVTILNGDDSPFPGDSTDFGRSPVGGSSRGFFRIQNNGSQSLTASVNSSQNSFAAGGVDMPVTPADPNYDGFYIDFQPTERGPQTSEIEVQSNDPVTPSYTFSVKGVGVAGQAEIRGQNDSVIVAGDKAPESADGTDFGKRKPGQGRNRSFTIYNLASTVEGEPASWTDLTISNIAVVAKGNVADMFSITTGISSLPVTIPAGGSHSFTLRFAPTELGDFNGTLRLTSDDPDLNRGHYSFSIKGRGEAGQLQVSSPDTEIANGDNSPSDAENTRFGSAVAGTERSQTLTLENVGNGTLNLTDAAVSSAAFRLQNFTGSLAPGESQTATLYFEAPIAGTFNGTLSIDSNDPDDDPFSFAVQGIAQAPAGGDFEITKLDMESGTAKIYFDSRKGLQYRVYVITDLTTTPLQRTLLNTVSPKIGNNGTQYLELPPPPANSSMVIYQVEEF